MKTIFIAILVIVTYNLKSQCLTLNELMSFFNKDIEKQDEFLTKMNYTISPDNTGMRYSDCEGEMVCTEFKNKITNSFIKLIHKKTNNKTISVEYRMKAYKDCYDLIKEGFSSNNFKKEQEIIKETSFYYFYSNNKLGIMLSKWKLPNASEYFYQVKLMQIEKYKQELILQKN